MLIESGVVSVGNGFELPCDVLDLGFLLKLLTFNNVQKSIKNRNRLVQVEFHTTEQYFNTT